MHAGGRWIHPNTRWALYARGDYLCTYCGCTVDPGVSAVALPRVGLLNVCDAASLDHTYPAARPLWLGCVVSCWGCNRQLGEPEPCLAPPLLCRFAAGEPLALDSLSASPRLRRIIMYRSNHRASPFDCGRLVGAARHLAVRQAIRAGMDAWRPAGASALQRHRETRRAASAPDDSIPF